MDRFIRRCVWWGLVALLPAQAAGAPASEPAPASRPARGTHASLLDRLFRAMASEPRRAGSQETAPTTQPQVRVSPRGVVEMHVADADLASVLKVLSIQGQRNIIASKAVSGKVTANLYGVTLSEALDAILGANGCGWTQSGNFIYVYTNEELAEMHASRNPPETRVFRLKYITSDDASKMIQPVLSREGKVVLSPKAAAGVASGGGSETGGNAFAADDCLVVYDRPERLEAVARLLAELDVRPKQVLIEATIVRAQLNEDNALGIDFNIVGGVDFEMLSSTSTGVTDLTTGPLPAPQLNNTSMTFRQDVTQAVPPGGFTFGIIKDSVAVFLRALEEVTDTAVMANPKVLALNKQRGEVIVGRRDGYLTTTITETTATQTVQFLETGTQLIFRPYIGDDGYVRMEIHPKDSTGGLTASNLPFEQTTEVTTNILVRDGHTILIGGLFREVTQSARSQTPYLGNLPVAGALFRTTRDSTQREEVIILLTVHIVKDDERLAQAGRQAADDVERYRVGMRRGLQVFGRERLAQAHYRWAMEHLSRGRTSQALWDARLAAYLNPKFLAAIKLVEDLTDRRVWDDDASSMRDFVALQIQQEQGEVQPRYGRPDPRTLPPAPGLRGPTGFESEPNEGASRSEIEDPA